VGQTDRMSKAGDNWGRKREKAVWERFGEVMFWGSESWI